MHFPRGIGPGLRVPQKSQDSQTPRTFLAVTCTCSQFGGHCSGRRAHLWDCRLQPACSTYGTQEAVSCCLHVQSQSPHDNDLLPLWLIQAFPWTPSAMLYQPHQSIFNAVNTRPLYGVQPPKSEPQYLVPTCHVRCANSFSAGKYWSALVSVLTLLCLPCTYYCAPF